MFRLIILLSFIVSWQSAFADSPVRRMPAPRCLEVLPPAVQGVKIRQPLGYRGLTSESRSIDLLIAYVPEAVTKAGSVDILNEEIRRMVSYANEAHRLSGAGVSFRLVHLHPLTTASSDNFPTDLRSAATSDGVWDELLTLREDYKADIVSVIVTGTQSGTLCGLGYLNGLSGSFAGSNDFMFNVVSISGSCPRGTLAHEIGHNMGSAHDQANATSSGWQPFSFGYNFKGNSREKWHTIMAVTNDREISYFSSPLNTYDGKSIGVESLNDNTTSLALAAVEVSQAKDTLNSIDLSLPVPSEPNKIKVTYKRVNNGNKIRITATLTSSGVKQAMQPVAIYFSRGKKGKSSLRALSRTKSDGRFIFNESPNIAPGIFYKACYLGAIAEPLCSKLVEIRNVR